MDSGLSELCLMPYSGHPNAISQIRTRTPLHLYCMYHIKTSESKWKTLTIIQIVLKYLDGFVLLDKSFVQHLKI